MGEEKRDHAIKLSIFVILNAAFTLETQAELLLSVGFNLSCSFMQTKFMRKLPLPPTHKATTF